MDGGVEFGVDGSLVGTSSCFQTFFATELGKATVEGEFPIKYGVGDGREAGFCPKRICSISRGDLVLVVSY